MQNCTDCGRPLPPNAFACPNCGKRVTNQTIPHVDETVLSSYSPAPQPPNPISAPPPGSSPYFGTPGAPQPPYFPGASTPQPTYPAGNPNMPGGSGMFGAQGTPSAPGGYNAPTYPPPGPQPGVPFQASGQYGPYTPGAFGAAPPPPPPPAKKKRGFSVLTLALLGAVALILLSGGIYIFVYTLSIRPAQVRTDNTATAEFTGTQSAQSAATVNAQGTGTAVAIAGATENAQAQATAKVVATETALQNVYKQATSGDPIYTSTLAGQDAANWQVYDSTSGGGCLFSGGALHSSIPKVDFYVPCFATAKTFDNFALEVEMTIIKGDGGGIIFRSAGLEGRKFYYYYVDIKALYYLENSTGDGPNDYKSLLYDDSPAFKKNVGQTNLLTIIARGDTITLYINKEFVATTKDATYKSGQIALFSSADKGATEVTFKNIKVWQL